MKQKRIKVTFVLMALLLLLSASAYGSSKPCDGCGRTPTKAQTPPLEKKNIIARAVLLTVRFAERTQPSIIHQD